ncbi:MAG: thermonuclease family protein, partial [Candidatus Kuenenbacteria bacterium]
MIYTKKRNIIIVAVIFLVGVLGGSLIKSGKEIIKYFSKDTPLYYVESVIDGDTFWTEINVDKKADETDNNSGSVKVRFYNIDAPEKGECYYEESRQALIDLIQGKYVRLIKDISEQDKYDRLLRYVILP